MKLSKLSFAYFAAIDHKPSGTEEAYTRLVGMGVFPHKARADALQSNRVIKHKLFTVPMTEMAEEHIRKYGIRAQGELVMGMAGVWLKEEEQTVPEDAQYGEHYWEGVI